MFKTLVTRYDSYFSTLPVEIRGNRHGRSASSAPPTPRHCRSRSAETNMGHCERCVPGLGHDAKDTFEFGSSGLRHRKDPLFASTNQPSFVEHLRHQRRRYRTSKMITSLGPVEVNAKQRAPKTSKMRDVYIHLVDKHPLTGIGQRDAVAVENHPFAIEEDVVHLDSEVTCQMVVAASGVADCLPGLWPVRRRDLRQINRVHLFEQVSNGPRGNSVMTVTPRWFDNNQPCIDQFAQMSAHCRCGYATRASQFTTCVSGSRQKRSHCRSSGRIGQCTCKRADSTSLHDHDSRRVSFRRGPKYRARTV